VQSLWSMEVLCGGVGIGFGLGSVSMIQRSMETSSWDPIMAMGMLDSGMRFRSAALRRRTRSGSSVSTAPRKLEYASSWSMECCSLVSRRWRWLVRLVRSSVGGMRTAAVMRMRPAMRKNQPGSNDRIIDWLFTSESPVPLVWISRLVESVSNQSGLS